MEHRFEDMRAFLQAVAAGNMRVVMPHCVEIILGEIVFLGVKLFINNQIFQYNKRGML